MIKAPVFTERAKAHEVPLPQETLLATDDYLPRKTQFSPGVRPWSGNLCSGRQSYTCALIGSTKSTQGSFFKRKKIMK